MTKPANSFRYFNSSPEVIRLVVMMYVKHPLSLRNVEDLLHERGIDLCYETVRFWWNRFGPMFAAEIRAKRVQRMRAFTNWRWHLDEVYVKINCEMHYLCKRCSQATPVACSALAHSVRASIWLWGWPTDDAGDDIGQVGFGIDVVEFSRLDERGQDRPVLRTAVGTSEQSVPSVQRQGADGAFDGVGVEFDDWSSSFRHGTTPRRQFEYFVRHLQQNYPWQHFVRAWPRDAHLCFDERSIDLLRINGSLTAGELRSLLADWLPKMSSAGVVVLVNADIAAQDEILELWHELKSQYGSFNRLLRQGPLVLHVGDQKTATAELFHPLLTTMEALGTPPHRSGAS